MDFSLNHEPNALDQEIIRRNIESQLMQDLEAPKIFELSDLLPIITEGAEVIVQDDFSKCFRESFPEPWNWNFYLFILWTLGLLVRYFILLPLRVLSLFSGFLLFAIALTTVKLVFTRDIDRRKSWERFLMRFLGSVFVFSWTGVIKYHGVIPKRKPNQIYVANHTSMIDVVMLQQMNAFSMVGQKHSGWVGYLQDHVLDCLSCIWFNRGESEDRKTTSERIKQHIMDENTNRLLIFPEGTCVNNKYCVQFKKGPFEMDAIICPIAIKYNKTFVDAFWNSRRRPFHWHLYDLMKSWAVVCDVWYLEPMEKGPEESSIDFAARVKAAICEKAGLIDVDWDGYMKYFAPSMRYQKAKQKLFAESLRKRQEKVFEGIVFNAESQMMRKRPSFRSLSATRS